MSEFFVISDVLPGKLNSLVKNLMTQMGIDDPNEAVRLINSKEYIVSPKEESLRLGKDGTVYLTVTSDGTNGPQWLNKLTEINISLSREIIKVLLSPRFKPTKNLTTELALFKFFKENKDLNEAIKDEDFTSEDIRSEAIKRGLTIPNLETVCLILEKFSINKKMKDLNIGGIVPMYNPIKIKVDVLGNFPVLILIEKRFSGLTPTLKIVSGEPTETWLHNGGKYLWFAFVHSQAFLPEKKVEEGWSLKFNNKNTIK